MNKILIDHNLEKDIEKSLQSDFKKIEDIRSNTINKVHKSILKVNISDLDLAPSSGYGYNDWGRDKIESVFAEVFGGEDSLVRPQISTGTQALYLSLVGTMLTNSAKQKCVLVLTGEPYPTIVPTFKFLQSCGVEICFEDIYETTVETIISKCQKPSLIYLQRSKGYSLRKSLSVFYLEEIISKVRSRYGEEVVIMVDNCYSEFVQEKEPGQVGADLIVGSLLKNPGGGMVSTGGYIVGKKGLINDISNFLYGIGVGKELGPVHNKKEILLGIYLAPLIVSESLKGVVFGRKLFHDLGFKVFPTPNEELTDIVLAVVVENKQQVLKALKEVQSMGPINPGATPEGSQLPGYIEEIAMAGGTFTPGSSIELSADASLSFPWTFYIQGSFYYELFKEACLKIARSIVS